MKSYAEKLKDPRWQKKRLEILERDGWACCRCSTKSKPLHVHHVIYIGKMDPWEYDGKYLATLCEDCHAFCSSDEVRWALGMMLIEGWSPRPESEKPPSVPSGKGVGLFDAMRKKNGGQQ